MSIPPYAEPNRVATTSNRPPPPPDPTLEHELQTRYNHHKSGQVVAQVLNIRETPERFIPKEDLIILAMIINKDIGANSTRAAIRRIINNQKKNSHFTTKLWNHLTNLNRF